MQALINFIIANLKAIWPVSRVYGWQHGLLIRGGKLQRELAPGLHWRWSILEEVYTAYSTEQTVDLPTAAITTSDGKSLALSANIAYRVISLKTLWGAVSNIQQSITNVAIGYLATECTKRSWGDLTSGRENLQAELAEHMSRQLSAWGVEVTRVFITDLVEARQWRVFSDAPLVHA
jgi:regulator of protease activity HflC (stomatin/prohibitin superfamily)